jgi:hypothetical protein
MCQNAPAHACRVLVLVHELDQLQHACAWYHSTAVHLLQCTASTRDAQPLLYIATASRSTTHRLSSVHALHCYLRTH